MYSKGTVPFWCSKIRWGCLTQNLQKHCFPGVTPATQALVDAGRWLWLMWIACPLSPFGNEAEMASGRHFFECLNGNIQTLKPTPVFLESMWDFLVRLHEYQFLISPKCSIFSPQLALGVESLAKIIFLFKEWGKWCFTLFLLVGQTSSNHLVLSN